MDYFFKGGGGGGGRDKLIVTILLLPEKRDLIFQTSNVIEELEKWRQSIYTHYTGNAPCTIPQGTIL